MIQDSKKNNTSEAYMLISEGARLRNGGMVPITEFPERSLNQVTKIERSINHPE